MSQDKRELRLFISSTFRDLIEEREELLKKVFPQLRHICRQRGIDFVEIDLRWGLTEQDSALGTVIRTCLEEIDRCRPFFLGILGSRYGWSPSFVDIQKDPELLLRYPWIEEAAVENASMLDLEITHALLRHKPQIGSFVYRRAEESDADEDGMRIQNLADRIQAAGVDIRSFNSVDALGRLVLEDLMSAINHYWPEIQSEDFLEHERREQAAFGSSRRKAYIANAEALRSLSAHAGPASKPLLIAAPSGQGKSALLAYWSEFIKRKQPDAIVLTHYVGLSTAGSGAPAILRHFVEELRAELGASDEKLSQDTIESEFRIWLSRVTDRPVHLIIDAVNQLDEQWYSMDWLPETERENIHWIVSTTGGPTKDALLARGWDAYYLGELSMKEREALIVRFLGDFRKVLTPAQLERIARSPNSSSPLFLRTLLEELRLFGNFESLDQVIDNYLSAPDLAGLFQMVLARMQEDFGSVRVRELLTLIWGARKGLSEQELVELTGVSKPKLTKFLLALEYQLMPRGGFITLFHDYLAQAIVRAYLPSQDLERKLHERLAKYFDEKELNERNAYELLWQLAQAGRFDRLRALLVSPLHFRFFMMNERKWEYLRYWRIIDQDRELAEELSKHLRAAADRAYSHEEERIEQVAIGAAFLHEIGQPQLALDLAEFAEAKLAELPEAFGSLRIQLLGIKGQAYQSLSDYQKAEAVFTEQIREAELVEGHESVVVAGALDNLGSLLYLLGRYEDARVALTRVASILSDSGSTRSAIQILINLSAVHYMLGDNDAAKECVMRGLELASKWSAPDLQMSLFNSLAMILSKQQEFGEAEIYLRRSIEICEELYGREHEETQIRMGNLGVLLFQQGHAREALDYLNTLLEGAESVFGEESRKLAARYLTMAEISLSVSDIDVARTYGERARAIFERCGMTSSRRYALATLASVPYLITHGYNKQAGALLKEFSGIFEADPRPNPVRDAIEKYQHSLTQTAIC